MPSQSDTEHRLGTGSDQTSLSAATPSPDVAPATAVNSTARRDWWVSRGVASIILPVVLLVLTRPERYGLTPNPLDPVFYTGYAINYDDIMREIGDRHYFVSRWSVYLPGRLATHLFGASLGRLMLRWVVASVMLLAVWRLGRQWRWSRSTEVVAGIALLANPMFARAFLTDYTEWVAVSVGTILVCLCLDPVNTWVRSALIGVLTAVIFVSNPVTATLLPFPLVASLFPTRGFDLRKIAQRISIVSAAFVGVLLGGLLYFRATEGIANVYGPTIDFIRRFNGLEDQIKSPRLTWMGAFVWIYSPMILVVFTLTHRTTRTAVRRSRPLRVILILMTVQFVVQVLNQFVRGGSGLEISYYWSFIVPTLGVSVVAVLGLVKWTPATAAAFSALWFVLLSLPHWSDVELPAGWMFAVFAVAVLITLGVSAQRFASAGAPAVAIVVLLTQVAAPGYSPFAYHPINASPHYDEVFFNQGSQSDRDFVEAQWLANRLDQLPDDTNLRFVGLGNGSNLIGLYGPHVTGRWFRAPNDSLGPGLRAEILAGRVPLLVVFGPSSRVEHFGDSVEAAIPRSDIAVSELTNNGGDFRLVVHDLGDPSSEVFDWRATSLQSQTGQPDPEAGSVVATPGVDSEGFLLFGPFIGLDRRDYRVTFEYSSKSAAQADGGFFDIAQNSVPVTSTPILDTAGETATATLEFRGDGVGTWEFRSFWSGDAELQIESVSIAPLADTEE